MSTTPAGSQHFEVAPDPQDGTNQLWLIDQGLDERSAARARTTLDTYLANCRLTFDERGPGYVDGSGTWNAFPPEVAQVRKRRVVLTHVTRASAGREEQRTLAFVDAAGRPLLRMSSLGWPRSQLEEFAALAGWDSDLSDAQVDFDAVLAEMPNFFSSPYVLMSGETRDPSVKGWLHRRFGRSPSNR